ncbi:hypothetical protein HT031_006774 [Scenedesmus sp. PABB004]|nr:hypothetical protein HT031_006774 [Scenedesmus sp. PABB004]
MLARQTALRRPSAAAGARLARAAPLRPARGSRRGVAARAGMDTNLFVNLIASTTCGALAAAVTLVTAEDTDKEIERIKTVEGATPLAAAIAADAVAHSIPGLNVLLQLLSEPVGAAAGVAYMMTLVLSAPAVDPATLAPKGTVLNAEKANDARAAVRVPFTAIIPTALKVVDFSNDASSGAGWTIGESGLPKLPVTSVLAVVGVGGLILEAASHAPVLSLIMPRVLSVAGWLAASGYLLDKRGAPSSSTSA